jgi:hypothetical protein
MSYRAVHYKMSFSSGGLFINESVAVARGRRGSETWSETLDRALVDGAVMLPKRASNQRTLREIVNRLQCLSDEEVAFLIEGDRVEQGSLLWLAACRAYRFVGEFAIEVVRERHLSYQHELLMDEFDIFFNSKAEWNDGLAALTDSTRLKLRQVLYRMMREAGLLSKGNRILPALLSARLASLIALNDTHELMYFPGHAFP